jgi:chromosomal replication initiation ATPase DnaA
MSSKPDRLVQIPLALPLKAGVSRDDLIVSASNRLAVDLVDHWPHWPSNMVMLAGPVGSGKSHVAAVWAQTSDAVILPMQALDDEFALSFEGNVVLEDASAGAVPEEPMFHLLNRSRAGGYFVMITSSEFPAAWGIGLPDLASRLKLAHLVELGEPDDELLTAIIFKLFADRQMQISPQLARYLVMRMERSLGAANALVDWMDREALSRKTKANRKLAAEALEAFGMV